MATIIDERKNELDSGNPLVKQAQEVATKRTNQETYSLQEVLDIQGNKSPILSQTFNKPKRQNDIIIINTTLSPAKSIVIQNRPDELNINTGTSWAAVKSFGRNNSFPLYTGSEEKITFKISWYSVQKDREDVIAKCRLLESWSKADGYKSSPPMLNLLWGNSGIFDDYDFILIDASYVLSNFQDGYQSDGIVHDLKLLPNCATQTITLQRVKRGNITHNDIITSEKMKNINGIK